MSDSTFVSTFVKLGKKTFGQPADKYNYWVVEVKGQHGIVGPGKKMAGRPWYKIMVKLGRPNSFEKDGVTVKYLDCTVDSFSIGHENFRMAQNFCQEVLKNPGDIITGKMDLGLEVEGAQMTEQTYSLVTETNQQVAEIVKPKLFDEMPNHVSFEDDDIIF